MVRVIFSSNYKITVFILASESMGQIRLRTDYEGALYSVAPDQMELEPASAPGHVT